jgi:curved DNA-binding protein CbpA
VTASPAPMSRAQAAELLGLAADAPPVEVQRAFLRAARHAHPDTLPEADDATRAAAAARFDALTRARAVLMEPAPPAPPAAAAGLGDGWAPRPGDPDGPLYRPVQGRGLGGSLVVLALLAFLMVAIVTFSDAFRQQSFDDPGGSPAATRVP